MLVLCCMSSAIIAEWTDMQSQVLSWTGVAPSIPVDVQQCMLVGNSAHGLEGMKLFRLLFWCDTGQKNSCPVQQVRAAHCRICLSSFSFTTGENCHNFLWFTMCGFYGISSGWPTYKSPIWQIRLIMMQMQNVGCWWAYCHKCLPWSCITFLLSSILLVGNSAEDLCWTCACSDWTGEI